MTESLTSPETTNRPLRDLIAQSGRFVVVGTTGTLFYLGLYAVAATAIDVVLANIAAWGLSTLATNEAHRRLTFGVTDGKKSDGAVAMVTSLVGLVLSSVTVQLVEDQSTTTQLIVLMSGTAAGGALRFFIMRWWFAGRQGDLGAEAAPLPAAAPAPAMALA